MKPKAKPAIRWTLLSAATEFGVSREAIRRGLRAAGVSGQTFTTRQIFTALAGDLEAERIRETRARADLLEMERNEKSDELITIEEHKAWQAKTLLPVRQRLESLASTMAHRCNPVDPDFARAALTQWVDEALVTIRAEMLRLK